MLEYIYVDNSLDVIVRNFRNAIGTSITNATMTFSIYTSAGVVLAAANGVSMSYDGSGAVPIYRGSAASLGLTLGARYKVVVTCTSHQAKWTRWFKAEVRPFREDA